MHASKLVALLMPGSPTAEVAEATRRWIAFLQLLDRMVAAHDATDSMAGTPDGILSDVCSTH
jgi:hypothetical protein